MAAVVGAYNAPVQSFNGSYNADGVVDIGIANQIKPGGLSVNTFRARGNALFNQDLHVLGQLNGGHPTDTTSIIAIGGGNNNRVATIVTGDVTATLGGQAKSIGHASASGVLKNVCATENGTFVVCDGTGTGPIVPSNPKPDLVLVKLTYPDNGNFGVITTSISNAQTSNIDLMINYTVGTTKYFKQMTIVAGSTSASGDTPNAIAGIVKEVCVVTPAYQLNTIPDIYTCGTAQNASNTSNIIKTGYANTITGVNAVAQSGGQGIVSITIDTPAVQQVSVLVKWRSMVSANTNTYQASVVIPIGGTTASTAVTYGMSGTQTNACVNNGTVTIPPQFKC